MRLGKESGKKAYEKNWYVPLAQAYSGHQKNYYIGICVWASRKHHASFGHSLQFTSLISPVG
jgi:hypothetical protein